MLEARTLSVAIDRSWTEVYDAIWRPEDFPRWASGLSGAGLTQDGDVWRAQGPEGPVTITFTERNAFGVMDHVVDLGGGREVSVPLRVIKNGEGAEVLLTLFRQPWMSDETFAADAAWIMRDLRALKALLEA
jgi:hypothetical protein